MKTIWHPSPNFNERPLPGTISTVVLHYTDMENSRASLERLCDPAAEVSAHYLIDEDGTIFQLVKDEMRAWHAGKSSWRGKDNVNDFSIGIELQNPGYGCYFIQHNKWQAYPIEQMNSLVILLKHLCQKHPINPKDIVGHSDVAPSRKIDPGPHFDWLWLAEQGFGKDSGHR